MEKRGILNISGWAGVAVVAVALLGPGCVNERSNDGGSLLTPPANLVEGYKQIYKVADAPVEAEDQMYIFLGLFGWGGSATHVADNYRRLPFNRPSIVMNGAFANACDKASADTIIGARYTVTDCNYLIISTLHAKVRGFPAKLIGVENVPGPFFIKRNGEVMDHAAPGSLIIARPDNRSVPTVKTPMAK